MDIYIVLIEIFGSSGFFMKSACMFLHVFKKNFK